MIVSKSPEDSAAGDDGSHHGGGKAPASKDKKCPYCHQAFTSSSLGRHLDQYLFKKKPDGIHDVDEIRRLRGNITRRQARTSGKRDSPDVGSGTGQRDSPSANAHDAAARPREGPRLLFNTPSWHSTGVINDIPDPSASHEPSTSSRPPSSLPRAVSTGPLDYASRGADPNSPDTARALELALREVLDNIKAATYVSSRTWWRLGTNHSSTRSESEAGHDCPLSNSRYKLRLFLPLFSTCSLRLLRCSPLTRSQSQPHFPWSRRVWVKSRKCAVPSELILTNGEMNNWRRPQPISLDLEKEA